MIQNTLLLKKRKTLTVMNGFELCAENNLASSLTVIPTSTARMRTNQRLVVTFSEPTLDFKMSTLRPESDVKDMIRAMFGNTLIVLKVQADQDNFERREKEIERCHTINKNNYCHLLSSYVRNRLL